MLLERDDVNPDQADIRYGRTPLSWAAGGGREKAVKMLLERKDVNPDQGDTEYGRTPLSPAAENPHEAIANLILEQNGICTTMSDNHNQAPPPSVTPKGRDGTVDILLPPLNVNSNAASCSGQASLPPPAHPRDDCLMEKQFSPHNPNANITDFNSQPSLPPAGSLSMSPDNDLLATKLSMPPLVASLWALKFPYLLRKSTYHPNNGHSTLSIVPSRYWAICSCLCLVALLAYRNNTHSRTSPRDFRVSFTGKLWKLFLFTFLKLGLRSWRRQDLRRLKRE